MFSISLKTTELFLTQIFESCRGKHFVYIRFDSRWNKHDNHIAGDNYTAHFDRHYYCARCILCPEKKVCMSFSNIWHVLSELYMFFQNYSNFDISLNQFKPSMKTWNVHIQGSYCSYNNSLITFTILNFEYQPCFHLRKFIYLYYLQTGKD